MTSKQRFHQGAAVHVVSATAPKRSWVRDAFVAMPARTAKAEARKLAHANRHKNWAKRWLKANGDWV